MGDLIQINTAPLRILFMGTPDFALPAFQALAGDRRFEVCLVLSRPDAPAGRGLRATASPISRAAREAGIELLQPTAMGGPEHEALLERLGGMGLDFAVVTAYGMLLSQRLLDVPRIATVNIHGSLLPRWRGAAPVERAILAGDTVTGVSIQRVRLELDSGPVYASAETAVGDKPFAELSAELAAMGAGLLADCLPRIAAGQLEPVEQDHSLAVYAAKLEPNELSCDPGLTVEENLRRVQASHVRHPSRVVVATRSLRVLAARRADAAGVAALPPGAAQLQGRRLLLAAADGCIELLELVPDGKRPMSGQAFAAGLPALQGGSLASWSSWR